MERHEDEIASYEIYKKYPEAFTLPEISEECLKALQANEYPAPRRLQVFNEIERRPSLSSYKRKNKGLKRKLRGADYGHKNGTSSSNRYFGYEDYTPEKISNLLRHVFPSGVIQRETASNIYVLCPYHHEKKASCCIGKKIGVVKCFGCGKSYALSTFLSITLGNTKKYRGEILRKLHIGGTSDHKNQLTIPFSETE